MRCYSCNTLLNDWEATRRCASTGDFLDMCNKCYKDVSQDIPTVCRADLNPNESLEAYEEGNQDEWGDCEVEE